MLSSRYKLTISGMATIAVLLTVFVWIEISRNREDLLQYVRSEAATLIETLNRGGEMTLLTNDELEDALILRLRTAARLADHLTEHQAPSTAMLAEEAEAAELAIILLYDRHPRLLASSRPIANSAASVLELQDLLVPILHDEYEWIARPSRSISGIDDTLFLLSHARIRDNGVVVVGVRSATLLALRKRLGIGKLVQDIASNPDISFVVLQDEAGIVTASQGVTSMSSISEDGFLFEALEDGNVHTRIKDHDGVMVYEVVRALTLDGMAPMISRIGLSLERIRDIQQRSVRRMLLLAGGLFLSTVLLLVFLLTRQRYNVLQEEHRKVQVSTQLVLDNIADAVVAIDARGRVVVFNTSAERMFTLDAQDVRDAKYEDIFPDDTLLLRKTAKTGPVEYQEQSYRNAAGIGRILAVSTSIIPSRSGEHEMLIGIARDLTEHRRVLEQLQQRDKLTAMGELAAGIAHEIRNPLNAIGIIAQRFQSEFSPVNDVEEYQALVRTIRGEVRRVNDIVSQFLEFAKPPEPVFEIVDLAELLNDSLHVIRGQATVQRIDVRVFSEQGITVHADRGRLKQALLNLLQNAIEAVASDGEIKCLLCKDGANASLTIADTGPGIPDDIRKRMFNLYFTTKSSGTGLGLGIAHQIISEHGGEITVASETNSGASFRILLPLSEAEHLLQSQP